MGGAAGVPAQRNFGNPKFGKFRRPRPPPGRFATSLTGLGDGQETRELPACGAGSLAVQPAGCLSQSAMYPGPGWNWGRTFGPFLAGCRFCACAVFFFGGFLP